MRIRETCGFEKSSEAFGRWKNPLIFVSLVVVIFYILEKSNVLKKYDVVEKIGFQGGFYQ